MIISGVDLLFGQTSDINEGCAPLTVSFTAPSGSPSHYWDFKDGASATSANPSNTFITPGTYIVEYKNSPGGAIVGTITITVYEKPVPEFTMLNSQGCAPLSVDFSDATTLPSGISIISYSWVLTNGATLSGANPSYTFGPGNYGVSLSIVTNLTSCNATEQYTNVINASTPPSTSFNTNPNPASSCTAPFSVGFSNTSSSAAAPLTYSWDLGNGNTSTQTNPPAQTYSNNGNYTVTLIATDTNGCSNSHQITVGVGQPEASFELPNDTLCVNTSTVLNNLSPAGIYSWNFGPNATPASSSLSNPSVTFLTPGYHDITLTLQGACPDDTTITVYVEEVDATFTSSPTFSCEDPYLVSYTPNYTGGATYEWTFGNDSTSTLIAPTNEYINEDTNVYSVNGPVPNFYYNTTLTVTSAAGCSASYSSIDTLHEPNALIIPDNISGCLPHTVTFNDSSASYSNIIDWEWHFGDGTVLNASTDADQTFTYNMPGVFGAYLVITNQNGCKDTSYVVPISVGDVINPDFTVSGTNFCLGDSIYFTDQTGGPYADSIDAWHYYAEGNRLFHCFDDPDPAWAFNNETGNQSITLVVEFNGCYSEVTKNNVFTVNGPLAEIYYHNECDTPNLVTFVDSTEDITNVIWNFGDGNTSTLLQPTHTYATTGDYLISLIAQNSGNSCPDDTAFAEIQIRNIEAQFQSDTILCKSDSYDFDASFSTDVNESCHHGYTWYFSDPNMRPYMTDASIPGFEFNQVGLNEIILVVEDVNGCKDTASTTVNVYGINADFTKDRDTICIPASINFTEQATSDTTLTQWSWSFGDGNTSTSPNPSHNFTNNVLTPNAPNFGSLVTTLTVQDTIGCTSSYSLTTVVYHPLSTISANDYTVCSGTDVAFTATDFTLFGSNLSYDWDFGDGNTSNLQNPQNTFQNEGTYPVTLSFEEVASGCQGTKTLNISVKDNPIADFSTPADTALYICPNDNMLFTNLTQTTSSNTTYFWDFDNGSTSGFESPGTIFTSNGTYDVTLVATIPLPYGCIDTLVKTYTVKAPYGDFINDLGQDTICRLDSVLFTIIDTSNVDTYYWDFGDGTSASNISPVSHQYTFVPPSGTTVAKLIMSNADGSCPYTQDTIINIYEVIADFIRNGNDIDTAVCPPDFLFENNSLNANAYYWDFGDGTTSTSYNPPIHLYNTPGTYSITLGVLNSQHQCTDTMVKDIIIFSSPSFNVIGDTICEGESGDLSADSINNSWNYFWTSNDGYPITDVTNPFTTSTPPQTGYYFLTVTDSNNCSEIDSTAIIVIPQIYFPNLDTIIVIGDSVYLPLNIDPDLYSLIWTPDTGLSCLNCPFPVVQPLSEVIYTVSISDNFGCFNQTAEYHIDIYPETFIDLPTTFTPNGDGTNDILYVEGWGIKELLEFKIFNRWGELIFSTSDLNEGWDGYHNGVLQNNDLYVVQVKATSWKNEEITFEGYINLMR